MELLEEKTAGVGKERHAPVVGKTERGIRVRIGSILHHMKEGHYIVWIEVAADGEVHREFLKPRDEPEAEFELKAKRVEAREYCNRHGLWKVVVNF